VFCELRELPPLRLFGLEAQLVHDRFGEAQLGVAHELVNGFRLEVLVNDLLENVVQIPDQPAVRPCQRFASGWAGGLLRKLLEHTGLPRHCVQRGEEEFRYALGLALQRDCAQARLNISATSMHRGISVFASVDMPSPGDVKF